MKRNLFDTVDEIHKKEQESIQKDIKEVREDMYNWQIQDKVPVNFDVFVIGKHKQ